MSDFTFFQLTPAAAEKMGLPVMPLPVRRERQSGIFPEDGDVDCAGLLDELAAYLLEHPEATGAYRGLQAALCYVVAIDAATQGYHAQAAHYLELGLDIAPDSVSMRTHYALALHCIERYAEARREYERVIADTPRDAILPIVWMMLARLYAQDGEYGKAYWLLQDVSTLIPDENGFWDFLGEMGEKAGIAGEVEPETPANEPLEPTLQAGSKAAQSRATCPSCGAAISPNARFCGQCGQRWETPPTCPHCAAPVGPDARFCGSCGKPLSG